MKLPKAVAGRRCGVQSSSSELQTKISFAYRNDRGVHPFKKGGVFLFGHGLLDCSCDVFEVYFKLPGAKHSEEFHQ